MQEAEIVTMVTQAQPPSCESFDGFFKAAKVKKQIEAKFSTFICRLHVQ